MGALSKPRHDKHFFPEEPLPLGKRLFVHAVAITGYSEIEDLLLLQLIAQALGVHPVHSPASWDYPADGKGGVGRTTVMPVTESFLAIDSWPDHGGRYLVVCSCIPFNTTVLQRAIADAGLSMLGHPVDGILGLDNELPK